ncbi:MAG: hypothetical protein ACREQ5_39145 [Candidatus Dormibacteria bacterium]
MQKPFSTVHRPSSPDHVGPVPAVDVAVATFHLMRCDRDRLLKDLG